MINLIILFIFISANAALLPATAESTSSYQERRNVALKTATGICKNELNFTMKTEFMHGFGVIDGYSRNSGCAYKCGRRTFRWDNGPQGFGDDVKKGTTTQYPSTLNMAATFDPNLALEWGTAMGEEFWGKGTNIQEGPGINVARIMRNGRNFEYGKLYIYTHTHNIYTSPHLSTYLF
jgi:beta-glucosidase-like glycosyl hydrolase